MTLFTREEKKNKNLIALYEKFVAEGMRPTKAAKKAREEVKSL